MNDDSEQNAHRRHRPASHVGIGLRARHIPEVLTHCPDIPWLEVHSENFMDDAPALQMLLRVRDHYPLSLHTVGLSLGSAGDLDRQHLNRLCELVSVTEPALVSDHLSWSRLDGTHWNDLLPLPYTQETLETLVRHVDQVQMSLDRQILLENPSVYLEFEESTLIEQHVLTELVSRTGCGILLDLNNLIVNAHDVGADPYAYINALPANAIKELHLAGHAINIVENTTILIDDHGSKVQEVTWALYRHAIRRFGVRPTLIEWDNNLPELHVLLCEARRAADEITAAHAHDDAVAA
jgi:uncharacterized protein (UPF0276 family)